MHLRSAVIVSLMTMCVFETVSAQQAPPFAIQNAMPPQVFASAGLSKLTPAELDTLSRWIAITAQNYANSQVAIARQAVPNTSNVIESRIDGDYNGWEGETVYKLQNGQVWQQSAFYYHYHYAYSPEVMIVATGTGAKMTVSGDTSEPVSVKRLR